uniref:CSON003520 protein n=1 Tax=Culicoides sonorensis TaxID=179676 RepID=A0A336MSP9_CULSO
MFKGDHNSYLYKATLHKWTQTRSEGASVITTHNPNSFIHPFQNKIPQLNPISTMLYYTDPSCIWTLFENIIFTNGMLGCESTSAYSQ